MVSVGRYWRLLCVLILLTGSVRATAATVAETPPAGANSDAVQSHVDRFQVHTRLRPHSLSSVSRSGLRLRTCLGVDPTCIGFGVQADLSSEALGFNLGLSVFPLGIIPIPSLNVSLRTVFQSGVYGYIGGSLTIIFYPVYAYGGGLGWEVEAGKKGQLLLKPQFGYQNLKDNQYLRQG